MGMTITEKIFARAAGKDSVKAGDLVNAKIDGVMCHDVTTPPAISMLKEKRDQPCFRSGKTVCDPGPLSAAQGYQKRGTAQAPG